MGLWLLGGDATAAVVVVKAMPWKND